MVYHVGDSIRTRDGEGPLTPGGGARLLNRNQKASARQLSLAAYLLSNHGRARDEASIREILPPYAEIHASSLARYGDTGRADDALRKQLRREPPRKSRASCEAWRCGFADFQASGTQWPARGTVMIPARTIPHPDVPQIT